MNRGQFRAQINTGWEILGRLKLQDHRNWAPSYPDHPAAFFRGLTYYDRWASSFANNYYDFVLVDNAIVQFQQRVAGTLLLSYSYLECPLDVMSYKEFVEDELGLDYSEARESLREDYEDYIQTASSKETVTPIRYDHKP